MYIYIAISFIIGTLFFQLMERSIDTESNCSYLASPWTDYLAFLAGAVLTYQGVKLKSPIVTVLGSTVFTEHIWQYIYHKHNGREMFAPLSWEVGCMIILGILCTIIKQ
jgi:hypothetical protein